MKLILCEKPSQAKDISRGLKDSFTQKKGYLEGKEYLITWAYGHLVTLFDPQDYDKALAKWDFATLPIIPEDFRYKTTEKGIEQFKIIKSLLSKKEVKSIVINTDAGREGELIARLILQQASNKKPCYRFWTSKALTPEVVRETYSKLKPAEEYDRLFQSALARQWADWLVGINASRAFSIKGGELLSIGRVQTPVLALICERELEIRNFKPEDYYNLEVEFKHKDGKYKGVWVAFEDKESVKELSDNKEPEKEDKSDKNSPSYIKMKEVAEQIKKAIDNKDGVIDSVISKVKTEKSPLLYSLTYLQQDANKVYGYTAQETLEIAQSLYETHKCLSYPRTESSYLNNEMVKDCERIVKLFSDSKKASVNPKNRVFNTSKLTDHHGLIPLRKIDNLNDKERKIFELVVKRFLAVFYPDFKYKHTVVITKVGEHSFKSIGKVVIDKGWKELYDRGLEDKELPSLKEQDIVSVSDSLIIKKTTTPPERYTDASILNAMVNAHRYIKDKELSKILKENAGIGTSATRASILEILKKRKYIDVKKKSLIPTEKGLTLIAKIKTEKIADVSYTALWEQELEDIANGKKDSNEMFLNDIKEYVKTLIDNLREERKVVQKENKKLDYIAVKEKNIKKGDNKLVKEKKSDSIGKCPECKDGEVREGEKNYYCSKYKEGCKFVFWKNQLEKLGKKTITRQMLTKLLKNNEISLGTLVSPKTGKEFEANGVFKKDEKWGWKIDLVFPNSK